MKLRKKVIYTFGLSACAALLYSAAFMASSAAQSTSAQEEYDEDIYGPEKLIVWNKPVPRVTFSHKVHTMDAGFDCDSCHDDLFEMEAGAAEEKDDFTMSSFSRGNYCGACHDGDTAFNAMSYDMCSACHTAPKTIVFTKPVKAVIFDHEQHVDDFGFNCTNCHSDIFKMNIGHAEQNPEQFTMEALYKGEYCGACHDGEQAFASDTKCTTCHIGVMGFDRQFSEGNTEKKGGH
ncbi:MAG: cytochrome c3 family protein [Desulfobulbaceae bacterium]|nr:cytochrome c3 family protein [Desulfobulbaceae bacterium]